VTLSPLVTFPKSPRRTGLYNTLGYVTITTTTVRETRCLDPLCRIDYKYFKVIRREARSACTGIHRDIDAFIGYGYPEYAGISWHREYVGEGADVS